MTHNRTLELVPHRSPQMMQSITGVSAAKATAGEDVTYLISRAGAAVLVSTSSRRDLFALWSRWRTGHSERQAPDAPPSAPSRAAISLPSGFDSTWKHRGTRSLTSQMPMMILTRIETRNPTMLKERSLHC